MPKRGDCICLYGRALVAEAENGHVVSRCSWCTAFPRDRDAPSCQKTTRLFLVDVFISLSLRSFSVMSRASLLDNRTISFTFARAFPVSRSRGSCHNFLKLIPWLALVNNVRFEKSRGSFRAPNSCHKYDNSRCDHDRSRLLAFMPR